MLIQSQIHGEHSVQFCFTVHELTVKLFKFVTRLHCKTFYRIFVYNLSCSILNIYCGIRSFCSFCNVHTPLHIAVTTVKSYRLSIFSSFSLVLRFILNMYTALNLLYYRTAIVIYYTRPVFIIICAARLFISRKLWVAITTTIIMMTLSVVRRLLITYFTTYQYNM